MMNFTPESIGAALGGGLTAAGIVIVSARRWMSKPAEAKIDALSVELGVGVGPSIASLVMSTASAVQGLAASSLRNGSGIEEILQVQKTHGDKLDSHESRLEAIETAHLMADKAEEVAAVLAHKTVLVAEALATKTLKTAKDLADKQGGGANA
jgi:hypothetical protein